MLVPRLRPGDVLVLGNLSAHKVSGICRLIEARAAELLYLPPYSPDLNPIEKAWFKLKQYLRAVKARTAEALDQAHQRSAENHHRRQRCRLVPPLRICITELVKMV